MSDGMRRELVYLSSYATNRYFIPNWGNAFALAVRFAIFNPYPQGAALGYVLIGLSARIIEF